MNKRAMVTDRLPFTGVVINECYGGFGLSEKAVMRFGEIKGVQIKAREDEGITGVSHYYYVEDGRQNYFPVRDIDRADPALVQVVEELGVEACDRFANLIVHYLPVGTKYRVQEYDGNEWIETERDIKWKVA